MRTRKYHNKKVTVDDIEFHSKKEAQRYRDLCLLEKAGAVTDLKRQVVIPLIPTQREEPCAVYKKGKNKGKPKLGKVIEKEVTYIADFVYTDALTGEVIVEDVKGFKTKDYILKRKMMLYFHNIRIREV